MMYRAKNQNQSVDTLRLKREKRARQLSRATAASIRQMCEPLEERVLLSKATIVDAGDFYWYQNSQIPLQRATDQVVVGYMPASQKRMTRLNNGLISKGGALAGYQLDQQLNGNSFSFKRTARGYSPAFESLQSSIQGLPAMKYFAPTFFSEAAPGRSAVTDEFGVNLVDNVDAQAFFGSQYPVHEPVSIGINNWNVILQNGGGLDVLNAANQLHGNAQVEYAEPNFVSEIVSSSFTPQDDFWNQQWNMVASHLPDAWDTTTGTQGSSDIVVAEFDDGIELDHPDLRDNIFNNAEELGHDEDGNGRIGDVNGWDFLGGDSDPNHASAADRHGTAVAGILAAAGNNIGVSGTARHIRILPVRISRAEGLAITATNLIAALQYASGFDSQGHRVWRGADVISGSFGGPQPAQNIDLAFQSAAQNGRGGLGMPIFLAAGNLTAGNNYTVQYPARLDSAIAVGAMSNDRARAAYSFFDANLDLVAGSGASTNAYGGNAVPSTDRLDREGFDTGMDNFSHDNSGDYNWFTGTSAATPLAAGVAALMLSFDPNQTADALRTTLLHSAERTNLFTRSTTDPNQTAAAVFANETNTQLGHGLVNASAAIAALTRDTAGPTLSSTTLTGDQGGFVIRNSSSATLTFTFNERALWSRSDISITGPDGPLTNFTTNASGTSALQLTINGLTRPGTYTATIAGGAGHLRDGTGNAFSAAGISRQITLQTDGPDSPTSVQLAAGQDTGNGLAGTATDGVTRITTPSFRVQMANTGAANPTQVRLTITGQAQTFNYTAAASRGQAVTVPTTTALANGVYTVTATPLNGAVAGNPSLPTSLTIRTVTPPLSLKYNTTKHARVNLYGKAGIGVPNTGLGINAPIKVEHKKTTHKWITITDTASFNTTNSTWSYIDRSATDAIGNPVITTIRVSYTDLAGNQSPTTAITYVPPAQGAGSFATETFVESGSGGTAPFQTPVIAGIGDYQAERGGEAHTTDNTLVFRGFAEPGSTVTMLLADQSIGSIYADDAGKWTFDYSGTPLATGDYTFTATTYGEDWDFGDDSEPFVVHVGSLDFPAPWINYVDAGDQSVYTGDATRFGSWVLSGHGQVGRYVIVRGSSGGVSAVIPVSTDGTWTGNFPTPTLPGAAAEDLEVEEVDQYGNPWNPYAHVFSEKFRILYDPAGPELGTPLLMEDDAGTGLESIFLPFSEPALGLALSDFTLTRNGTAVAWGGATLDGSDPANWALRGLNSATATAGDYVLTRTGGTSGIADALGNAMTGSFPPVKFTVGLGTAGADTFRLTPSTVSGFVDVIVNGTTAFTTSADTILLSGLGGDDLLIDELPASLRPKNGTFFRGGDGTDAVRFVGTSDDEEVNADDGIIGVGSGGDYGVDYFDAEQATLLGSAGADQIHVWGGEFDLDATSLVAGTLLDIEGGSVNVSGDLDADGEVIVAGDGILDVAGDFDGSGDLTLEGTADLTVDRIRQDTVIINDTARLSIRSTGDYTGEDANTSIINSLTMGRDSLGKPTALLDLGNQHLILRAPNSTAAAQAMSDLTAMLGSAYASGTWQGPGLTSSLIDSSNAWQRAVGVIPNSSSTYSSFGGQSVGTNDVLVRYTLNGDANLDGAVGFPDMVAVNQHYGQSGKLWPDGDFNFDGTVGFADLVAMNQNYGTSMGSGGSQMMVADGGGGGRSEEELAVAAELRKKIAEFEPEHLAEFDAWYTVWAGGGLSE